MQSMTEFAKKVGVEKNLQALKVSASCERASRIFISFQIQITNLLLITYAMNLMVEC